MNKERAREVLTKIKERVEQEQEKLINNIARKSVYEHEIKRELQALDIAIESLDNEWRTGTPQESGFYLVTNGANKLDIRKYDSGWYHDMYRRYTNEELKVIAWKKVEPYVRSEDE